jgi:hypothetical protein
VDARTQASPALNAAGTQVSPALNAAGQVCVFQDWLFALTMQQQSVLVLACRGPDGVGKVHPCKRLVAAYRASVLKAAYLGRAMRPGESDTTTFMSLGTFLYSSDWSSALQSFFDTVDELPHHYYMHLMHGAQIIGYHHPDSMFRERWSRFYEFCCRDLHLTPETMEQMDRRLSDWERAYWGE